jgi:acyl-CoA carboxylase subunit beta
VGEYAPVTTDWRGPLLAGALPLDVPRARRDPSRWPGYEPKPSVTAVVLAAGPVAALWDFTAYGGSFGEDDATALVTAAAEAERRRVPLLTVVRSGGTRLQEGMAALVGIPRARLALLRLSRAGLPHVSVADMPTTGGVWISVASGADLRVAVEGATVGFAGPRVVEAVTGELPPPGSHTASSAYAVGLVDAVLPGEQVPAWLAAAWRSLSADPTPVAAPEPAGLPATTGWEQVLRARARTTSGSDLLGSLLSDRVALRAPGGDETVAAVVGRLSGRPVVGVAVAAGLRVRPTPDGYRLATRAYRLAGRLGLPVLSLVDTPGAEPGTAAEEGGIAPAIGEALDALLTCPSPTVALVHGEGGSGGAVAASACDTLLLTPDSYFAAIGPEGAAAALRRPARECADLLRLRPADLLALGAADAVLAAPADVAWHVDRALGADPADRLRRREERWSARLPGSLPA